MPKALPPFSASSAASNEAWAARWVPRSTGTASIAVKKLRLSQPLNPVPVKYSALARKTTGRGVTSGITTLSMKERWLLARITAPRFGTFSRPTTTGR